MHVDIAGVMENKDEVSYLSPGMAGECCLNFVMQKKASIIYLLTLSRPARFPKDVSILLWKQCSVETF